MFNQTKVFVCVHNPRKYKRAPKSINHLGRSVRYGTIIYARTFGNLKVHTLSETKLWEIQCEPENRGEVLMGEFMSYS